MPNLRYMARTTGKRVKQGLNLVRGLAAVIIEWIPPKKRLPALAGLCLFMVLVLGMLVTALVTSAGGGKNSPANAASAFQPLTIPAEDLFLPGEPDFLPGVILEREPRDSWTVEDARPFWTDPLDYGEEPWREGIKSAVDELLERVP